MPADLSSLIARIRILAQDKPTSHQIFQESLGTNPVMPINGSNRNFQLKSIPVVASLPFSTPAWSVYVTLNVSGTITFRSQSGFTIPDPTNGIINFTVAPATGTLITVDYNYLWFPDDSYTEWLNEAAQETKAGVADPTLIPEGLIEPMLQYALGMFAMARASFFAEQYKSSGGDQTQEAQTKAQAYLNIAKAANTRGDFLKKDFYQRQGQREAPASAVAGVYISPITPRR